MNKSNTPIKLLDCTLRDGGYYNNWDFSPDLVSAYLDAMAALSADFIEIGFRSIHNSGFKGGFAFSTDSFIDSLNIPEELQDRIGVMVNASELLEAGTDPKSILNKLFTEKSQSPVTLVRIACHIQEFEHALPAANWLKDKGYKVGFNLMQIASCSKDEITSLAKLARQYPIDVLYFADSMGSLNPDQVADIIKSLRKAWTSDIGIHTHDNMNQALANSIEAVNQGVTWVDSTVTGMGRGPGNVQTEYAAIALNSYRHQSINITRLLELIRKHFKPLQQQYGWGTNPYYDLAGQYGIHPSYIQQMLMDKRYSEEDILSVIEHLKKGDGKKFSLDTLASARQFFEGEPQGEWAPQSLINGKEVLILATGPGMQKHKTAIVQFIKKHQPFVIALNARKSIDDDLIDIRAACHPVRLLADSKDHLELSSPLATPYSMLPADVKQALANKTCLDFGIDIASDTFHFGHHFCTLPSILVVAYALAIASSGKAGKILLAGFDGYQEGDPRRKESAHIFQLYLQHSDIELLSITPTAYEIPVSSVYSFL